VRQEFNTHTPLLREATFTEIFYFIALMIKDFVDILGIDHDVFKKEKEKHNKICLAIYKEVKEEVFKHPQSLDIALYLSIRGNWIDNVEDNLESFLAFLPEEINNVLDDSQDLIFHKQNNPYFQLEKVKEYLAQKTRTILYELDNSGEVIFDLLLIELLLNQGHKIIIASKRLPILNDITYDDLSALISGPDFHHFNEALHYKRLEIIHTNARIAGKYLFNVSEAYKKAYEKADCLILKGQGNFQTMPMGRKIKNDFHAYAYKKPIIYMLGIKANVILHSLRMLIKPELLPKKNTPFMYFFDARNPKTYLASFD
jgi:uncharacterized protein with ATP-grasp and redox domains